MGLRMSALVLLVLVPAGVSDDSKPATHVTIHGPQFFINGQPTCKDRT